MTKTAEQDYCLWTTNCNVLGTEKLEACEKHRCCYTCSKKAKCSIACIDRETKSHTCRFLISKKEAELSVVRIFSRKSSSLEAVDSTQIEDIKDEQPQENKRGLNRSVKASLKSQAKAKKLWKVETPSVPTSVKDLASQTGATYARANYLIRTKKLSFEEAFKILADKG